MKIELRDDNPLFEMASWVIRAASTDPEHGAALHCLKVEENRIYATNKRQVHIYQTGALGWTPGLYRINPGEIIGPKGIQGLIVLELNENLVKYPDIDSAMPDVSKFKHVSLTKLEGTGEQASVAYARIVRAMRPDAALNMDYFKGTFEGTGFADCFVPIEDGHRSDPIAFYEGLDRFALVSPMIIKE